MYCPDVWTKTAENAKAAGLKVQVTTVGSAAAGAGAQTTVYADGVKWLAANNDKWDSVALMLYGSGMVGQGWNICCCGANAPTATFPCGNTYTYIKQWLDHQPSIQRNKIILAMTATQGAGLKKFMVDFFADIVQKEGLKGVAFWNGVLLDKSWIPTYQALPSPPPACPADGVACPP